MDGSLVGDSAAAHAPSGATAERATALFHQVGFMRSWGAISPDTLAEVTAVTTAEFAAKVPPFRTAADGRVVRLDAVYLRHPSYRRLLEDPAVLEPLRAVLGSNIEVVLNRHNHATLNHAGDIPVRLHRDVLSWSRPIVTIIVYLDDAPAERGATLVVPGSHLLPATEVPPDGGGGAWADDHDAFAHLGSFAVPVPVAAGEALIFSSLLFHSVGHNLTDSSRTSVSFGLRATDELDDRPGAKTDLLAGTRRYLGNDLDYGEVIPAMNSHQADRREHAEAMP